MQVELTINEEYIGVIDVPEESNHRNVLITALEGEYLKELIASDAAPHSINGLGGSGNWFYTVNGEDPKVRYDYLAANDGDEIHWIYVSGEE